MSRSFKRTPIIGWNTAQSDKDGKRQGNKRFRRKIKVELLQGKEVFTNYKRQTTAWDMPKDGKHFVHNLEKRFLRK